MDTDDELREKYPINEFAVFLEGLEVWPYLQKKIRVFVNKRIIRKSIFDLIIRLF